MRTRPRTAARITRARQVALGNLAVTSDLVAALKLLLRENPEAAGDSLREIPGAVGRWPPRSIDNAQHPHGGHPMMDANSLKPLILETAGRCLSCGRTDCRSPRCFETALDRRWEPPVIGRATFDGMVARLVKARMPRSRAVAVLAALFHVGA